MRTGYDASVWSSPDFRPLLVAPNWLGDGVMAMPAVQVLRSRMSPQATLTVAARPGQDQLWQLHADVNRVFRMDASIRELAHAVSWIKQVRFTHALLIPHSFRSALAPTLAEIPRRRGTVMQTGRKLLINDPVDLSACAGRHQQWEIAEILLGGEQPDILPPPRLTLPEDTLRTVQEKLKILPRPLLACVPGAARGPSKQWPGERFQAVAKEWIRQTGGGICWLGTPADRKLCKRLNGALGTAGAVLAGETSLPEFAACLHLADHALVNDSGGMHLAAATGTALTAIFGLTDPGKTGPLSEDTRILQAPGFRSRRIAADSPEARAALEAVSVDQVLEQVLANPAPNS